MLERVIVKGWRGRQEEYRAQLRDRLWTSAQVVALQYDDHADYRGVSMAFDQMTRQELRRLKFQAEWQSRKDDQIYRDRHKDWHAAWREANREHVREQSSAWQKSHPEVGRAKAARARAKHPHRSAIYMQLMRLAGLL